MFTINFTHSGRPDGLPRESILVVLGQRAEDSHLLGSVKYY